MAPAGTSFGGMVREKTTYLNYETIGGTADNESRI